MKRAIATILLFFVMITAFGQNNQEIPFTQQDRDRIIRTEQKVESLRNEVNTRFEALETKMDTRFESQQHQIDDLKTHFYWGFGIMITLMIFMMGYMIWDRRTAMNPIREKVEQVAKKQEDFNKVLIEYSRKDPKLAEILKTFGIL